MSITKLEDIRNFCIIAHIDHGKSTLADRLLELTKTLDKTEYTSQVLDNMDIEQERGITIKSHPIQMYYEYKNKTYKLNLIDTPGHVDFTYEVSRSMAACEGALLLIDCTQGVEAQTVSNTYLAVDSDLEIIPVINKIDSPLAETEKIINEVTDILGFEEEEIFMVSAKEGTGVKELLEQIIINIPAPKSDSSNDLKALIFDSKYDSYKGAIA